MIKKSPSLLGGIFTYSFFNILNASIPFFLLPILTNSLSLEGYGIVAMFTIFVSFIVPIIGFSVNSAITRQYYFLNEKDFKVYIGNIFYILFFSFIILMITNLIFNNTLCKLTGLSLIGITKAIIIAAFLFGHSVILNLWQVQKKIKSYGFFLITHSILNLCLTILFVSYLGKGWEGRINAWMISAGMMFGFVLFFLQNQKMLLTRIDKQFIIHALKFGIPLIPHAIGGLLIALSDRLIISNILNFKATGIYTVAFQMASVLGVLMSGLNTAYVPWLFEKLKIKSDLINRQIVTFTYFIFILILLFVFIGSYVFSNINIYIIDSKFQDSQKYIFILLLAFGFNGMYLMVTNYLFFIEKTALLARNTFLISVLNIPTCYYLTKWYGINGASYSTVIAYFLLFVVTWINSARLFKMPWKNPILFRK